MRLPPYLAFIATIATSASSLNAQETSPDPWFEKGLTGSSEDERDGSEGMFDGLKSKSPRALHKSAMARYTATPEGNLSQRIAILEEANSIFPNSEETEKELEQLKALQRSIWQTLDDINDDEVELYDAIDEIGKHSRYLTGDTTLLFKLLESPFADRLNSQVRQWSRDNAFDELSALQNALKLNQLDHILGRQVEGSASSALARQILKSWYDQVPSKALLPGERYLVERLLGENSARLPLALELPDSVDTRLERNIARSLEREWQKSFQIVTDSQQSWLHPDFVLAVETARLETSYDEAERQVASSVPGASTEVPNPDFMELARRYEKAANGYELAMKAYEANYEIYMQQFEQGEYEHAQNNLSSARENLAATPPPVNGGPPSAEFAAALESYEQAEALANSITPANMPEPVKPRPTHLELLEELYLTPSTLIDSEAPSEYEYTAKELDYQFLAEAGIALITPTQKEESSVRLEQSRTWTQNLQVDPRDPQTNEGTFSRQSLDSALDLFTLEFGTHCSRRLSELVESALSSNVPPNGLAPALSFIALKTANQGGTGLALEQVELERLAQLAQSTSSSPDALRVACLRLILSQTDFSQFADESLIAETL